MQLLFPELLWALGLLALPIAIHLFNFQRPKKVVFSNVRFLRSLYQKDQASRTLKHYLVLASRLLMLAALIMAFTQPLGSDQQAKIASPLTSIWVDNSLSMSRYAGQSTALDVAISSAEQIIGKADPSARLHLLTNDFTERGQFFFSKSKTLDHARATKLVGNYRDVSSILARQKAAYQTEGRGFKPHLIWISDFQKSTLGDLKYLLTDTTFNLTLVPVKPQEAANLVIDSVYADAPFVQAGQKVTLYAQVRNTGAVAAENLIVKLSANNIQVSTAGISVPARSTAIAKFDYVPDANQEILAKIELADPDVVFDNQYFLVLKPAPKINVVAISEKAEKALEQVFGNKTLFQFNQYSATSIDFEILRKANLIVLNGVEQQTNVLGNTITDLVRKGASVACFPRYPTNQGQFSALMASLGAPYSIGPPQADSLKRTTANSLVLPDRQVSFFSGVFEDQTKNTTLPFAAKALDLKGGSALLKFGNGKVYLSEATIGKGKIYVAAGSLNQDQSDLTKQGLFVPIMLRMGLLSLPSQQQLAYSVQEPTLAIGLIASRTDSPFKLVSENSVLVPGQQLTDGKLLIDLPKAELNAGYYKLTRGDSTFTTIAVNLGKEESRLECYTKAELEEVFKGAPHVKVTSEVSALNQDTVTNTTNSGWPYWLWLVLLAGLASILETVLLKFFR